jgi:DNA-binding NarL/FixJ family response regulator
MGRSALHGATPGVIERAGAHNAGHSFSLQRAAMMKIRVLIADDHQAFRNALRCLLEVDPDIVVIGEASSGQEACAMALDLLPHIVCIDFRMSQMDGAESTRRLTEKLPQLKIIGLSASNDSDTAEAMLSAGASIFINKQHAADELGPAIHALFLLVEA